MNKITSEKSFYIMDYSYNYYRVNSKDQLVAAGNENEATIFSFADANQRIGAGPKSKFYFMTPVADEEDEVSDIPQESVIDETKEVENNVEATTPSVKEIKETEISKYAEGLSDEYDLSSINWEEYLADFSYILSNIPNYREELNEKISVVDKKICDVLHYIEFCDTDEADAKDLVELLKVCRENRRIYLDETMRIDSFQRGVGNDVKILKVDNAVKAIHGLETRKYTARELPDLFENGVFDGEKRTVDRKTVPAKQTGNNADYQTEVIQMDYIKKETPFDGKENDWLEFARKQAEFYENVNQYIVNQEIELDEIDNAIANLMDRIEVANCNVTQGYKMFKQLKELRQARTKKETELSILYNLTGNFDMASMAEECKRSAEEIDKMLNDTTEEVISIAG